MRYSDHLRVVGSLPSISRDHATVMRKLEKAKRELFGDISHLRLSRNKKADPSTTGSSSSVRASANVSQPAELSLAHYLQPLHQPPISLNRHLSEPNIWVDTQQSGHNYALPNCDRTMLSTGTEATSQFPAWHFTLAEFCDPSLGWDRRDVRAEPIQDVTPVQDSDLPPIMSGYHHTSLGSRYPSTFSNPFNDNIGDGQPRSSGFGAADPTILPESIQSHLHDPGFSSLVPIARSAVSEEEHDSSPPDPSVSKTYSKSFVSLPGNAVRKRRPVDATTRSSVSIIALGRVKQRHGNKQTTAEFKELRKQWRKAKNDETERMARLDGTEDRYNIGSEHATMQYPPQPYERQHRSYSYGRPPLCGPGIPGPEWNTSRLSGIPQQATPISPTWPEQSTQYEGSTPPHPGPEVGIMDKGLRTVLGLKLTAVVTHQWRIRESTRGNARVN
ncbi:hypothetical protein EDB89DRAFT_1911974 [Lactarius sanguifluus]|nr:hypothetical protein EDB89DRAFT_1911974 [Lactarius sanguifluus]